MNRKLFFLTTALISGFTFTSANAGFEWNPPPVRAAAQSNAQPESLVSDKGGPLTPMIGESARVEPVLAADIMDNAAPLAPVTQTNVPGMKSINGMSGAENDMMLPVPGEAMPLQNTKTVEGFGKDIPLATALTQIVPANYTVAYDGGVDQGKPVSWKGGKAWNEVLSDMLSAKKLHAVMSGNNTIRIAKGAGPALNPPVNPVAMAAQNTSSSSDSYDPIVFNDAPVAKSGRPVIDMSQQKKWTAPAGQSLRETLSNWSGQANVELAWQSMKDMKLKSNFTYDGTYDQAVDALLSMYSGENNEPHGKLYPNLPEGPSVLVISSN